MLAIGVAVAITFLLLSYDDLTTELYYPSFAEANTGDARTDHWIPPVLQESSTDIHVVYGIDPSFLRVSFLFSDDDRDEMLKSYRAIEDASAIGIAMESFNDAGWLRESGENLSVLVPSQMPNGATEDVYLFISGERNAAWYMVD